MPMSNPEECRNRAVQCFQLAAAAGTALQRTVLLNTGNQWIALAKQGERDLAWQKLEDEGEPAERSRAAA